MRARPAFERATRIEYTSGARFGRRAHVALSFALEDRPTGVAAYQRQPKPAFHRKAMGLEAFTPDKSSDRAAIG
jgi:hypothetical protein